MTSEEIAGVVEEIRRRVRSRYEKQVDGMPDFCLPSLDPVGQARDAALGKVAAIGTVNPRPPGLLNSLFQSLKKIVARALAWHVREQVEFNRAVIDYMDRTLAALDEHNRHMLMLAQQGHQNSEVVQDTARHVREWRAGWEERWTKTEIHLLRTMAELQAAFQHRVMLLESSFRDQVRSQHADYLGALDRANLDIQKRLWDDLTRQRQEHERQIQTELRLIRQRAQSWAALPETPRPSSTAAVAPDGIPHLDYARFAERFRGDEEYVRSGQRFYWPYFEGRSRVLDLGCGRGEFLELMKQNGVAVRGVDCDP